jgi:tetratricopeptide (TPR) repeat protein
MQEGKPAPSAPGGLEVSNRVDGTVVASTVLQVGSLTLTVPESGGSVPHQLPPAPRRFVNRRREIAELDAELAEREAGSACLVQVTGMRGVGKTATSRHWAHRRIAHFTDGQLHADLGELRREGGVPVGELLGSFLTALGVPEEDVPAALPARSALYRSRTAGKRLLLMLENVQYADEVRALIPSAEDSMVLITARSAIGELISGEGASLLRLHPLQQDGAQEILARGVQVERLEREPGALQGLLEICAGLPVALRVCAALLAVDEERVLSSLLAELSDPERRLARIVVSPGRSIDLIFSEAYRTLRPESARLYRLLSVLPSPSFTVPVCAVLMEAQVRDAEQALDELTTACLLEEDAERYRLHSLLALHARGCAAAESTDAELRGAFERVLHYYLFGAQRMDRALVPVRSRLAPDPPAGEPSFATPALAIAWFEAERSSLLSLMRVLEERGFPQECWGIGEALWIAYHNRKHFGEALEVYGLALSAARSCGDLPAQARTGLQLSRALMDLEDLPDAERTIDDARELALLLSEQDPSILASTMEFTGVLLINQGRYPDAIQTLESSLAAFEALANRRGCAIQHYHLGRALLLAGEAERGRNAFQQSLALLDPEKDGLTYGRSLLHLADALSALDERSAAIETLQRAEATFARYETPYYVALAREAMGDCYLQSTEPERARESLQVALAIFELLGSPRAARLTARLADLR